MGGVYFADTFYWIALAHPRDASRAQVATWTLKNRSARLITTEEILSELLTWFAGSGPAGRANAVTAVRKILSDPTVQVLPQTTADFHAAFALYEARLDKDYSLVHCRSIVALKALSISEVLTNDHHFTQEGFTVLFP